jgi:hypothetical protein
MRNRRCAHLATSVTPLEPHVSCVAVATCTSRGVACSPVVEVPPPWGPGNVAACSHKGTVVARPLDQGAATADLVKGKCALGPFLSILVIECKHKGLNVKICSWMNKVQITSKGMFLSLSTLVLCTNILV